MTRVGVFLHPDRSEAKTLADEASQWLVAAGHEVCLDHASDAASGCRVDLAISIGGDGTMLRTIDAVAAQGVPVLGVNVGHLGYLTEVEPAGLTEALARYFSGEHGIEERMTLAVRVEGPSAATYGATRYALNEAVVEKTLPGHTIRLAVAIDGEAFMTYAADALIVATPTGTTAYNLSARGPIAEPGIDAIVITPVSPHMLFDRSLVLSPGRTVTMSVVDGRRASLVVDGRELAILGEGDTVVCTAGPAPARLVTFQPRQFHRILRTKFGLRAPDDEGGDGAADGATGP